MLAAWWAATLWAHHRADAPAQHVLDLGAGTGLVGLALGRWFPNAALTLVERQPSLAERAAVNAARNGLAARTEVVLHDLRDGLPRPAAGPAQLLASNPPFHPPQGRVLPQHPERRIAHYIDGADIDTFVSAAAGLLAPGGLIAVVFPWQRRAPLLAALAAGPWGDVVVQPISHREDGKPPVRVLAGARRIHTRADGASPPVTWPTFALHGARADDARYHDRIERFLAGLGPRC